MDTQKLTNKYPTLKVRNNTMIQQNVLYSDGDSVTIQAGATRSISSAGLGQIPDISQIELLEPTIFDLEKDGIISLQRKEEKKAVQDTPPEKSAEKQIDKK